MYDRIPEALRRWRDAQPCQRSVRMTDDAITLRVQHRNRWLTYRYATERQAIYAVTQGLPL